MPRPDTVKTDCGSVDQQMAAPGKVWKLLDVWT